MTVNLGLYLVVVPRAILSVLGSLAELLAGMHQTDGAWLPHVTDDWKQGRTLYGGLSAALCIETATRSFEALPRLRSAQFAFVGPASGDLQIRPSLLRRGKSTAFISVDMTGEAGLTTRALLCFGSARPSAMDLPVNQAPAVPGHNLCPPFVLKGGHRPQFLDHFEVRDAGTDSTGFLLWARLQSAAGIHPVVAATALADLPPPAVLAHFGGGVPVSTMTWQLDYLSENQAPYDGWYLIACHAQTSAAGYSSQTNELWTSAGIPVIASRQSVAVFA